MQCNTFTCNKSTINVSQEPTTSFFMVTMTKNWLLILFLNTVAHQKDKAITSELSNDIITQRIKYKYFHFPLSFFYYFFHFLIVHSVSPAFVSLVSLFLAHFSSIKCRNSLTGIAISVCLSLVPSGCQHVRT